MKDKSFLIGLVLAILMIGGISALVLKDSGSTDPSVKVTTEKQKTSREVALACTSDEATKFHIHPVLKIEVNGKNEVVPSEIGITKDCLRSIHTHDTTGQIHVEAPEKKDFTLADFFAVWRKPIERQGFKLTATVNGQPLPNPLELVLKDDDQILLSYTSL